MSTTQTRTPTSTLDLLHKLIRIRKALRLSTGAYGDEGILQFHLEEQFVADYGSTADKWLVANLYEFPEDLREAIANSVAAAVGKHTPVRYQLPQEDVDGILATAQERLDADPLLTDEQRWEIVQRLVSALMTRNALDVPRGGPLWEILMRNDLFQTLGLFLVEVE